MDDGSTNAPVGSPQLPTLLSSYGANRPAWDVAGVDYAVGYPAGTVLRDPATISMAGVSVNTSTKTVTVTGNNVTLDGYDFSLNGGWGVVVQGANTRIVDSNFLVGANNNQPIFATASSSNLYVGYCVIDGNNKDTGTLVEMRGVGSLVVEYSSLKNAGGDLIQMHKTNSAPGDITIQYNLMQNAGMATGAHGDYTEFLGGPYTVHINYNTTVQTAGGTQGLMVEPDFGSAANPGVITGGETANNTMISTGSGFVTYMVAITAPDVVNTFTIRDNYFATNGYGFSPGGVRGAPNDSYSKTFYIHNVNMKTGAVVQDSNAPTVPSAPTVPTITSFSTDTGALGDGVTNDNALTLAGTAVANSTVKVFDGANQIGTATANSGGAWTYTTAVLADGPHSLTAKDSAGTTSTALSVTIDTLAPSTPSIVSNSINAGKVTLNGTAEANSTVQVLEGSTQLGTVKANSSGAWTYTTAALTTGPHNLTAKAMDAAGNNSGASSATSVTIGTTTTVPTVPVDLVAQTTSWSNLSYATQTTNFTANFDATPSKSGADITIGLAGANADAWTDLAAIVRFNDGNNIDVRNGSGYGADVSVPYSAGTDYHFRMVVNLSTHTYSVYVTPQGGSEIALATNYAFRTEQATDTSLSDLGGFSTSGSADVSNFSIVSALPGPPTIAAFSTDSGTTGDRITNDKTLTLSGTAAANSTVNVFDGANQIGTATANSSGAWTYTTIGLAEGSHSLTAKNSAGTTSTPFSVTIDTLAPSTPAIVSNSVSASKVTLSGTAEANSTVQILEGSAQLGTATTNSSGAWTYTTAALSTGTHDLTAKAMDAAGNTSGASTAASVTIGSTTQAPATPKIISFTPDTGVVGDGITDPAIITLTGSAVANSTVSVYDGTKLLGTSTVNASGAWSYTTAPLPDGMHKFTATSTMSGTTSAASAVMSVITDTVDPAAPTIASFSTDTGTPNDRITNDNTLTLTGTAEANSTVTVFDGAKLLGSAVASSSGAWSYTTVALANGAHSLTAKASDAAANTSVASAALDITVTAPPGAPTITSFSPDTGVVGDGITDPAIITLTGSALVNSAVSVYDGTKLLGTATANASGAWSYTTAPLPDGMHKFTATSTMSGTTSAASAVMSVITDTVDPAAPTIASFSTDTGTPNDRITNDNTLTLTGTAEANSTVTVFDGAKLLGSAVASSSGAWSYTTAALADGAHSLTAKASDAAANTGAASSALVVTIDKAAPVAPTIASFSNDTGTLGDHITNDTTLTMMGTAEANSTVKIYDGATFLGSAAANGSGAWNYTTGVLQFGSHSFNATDSDAAGNVSAASSALNVSVEKPPLAVSVDGYSAVVASFGFLKGTADANSMVWLYDGTSGAALGVTISANGSWQLPVIGQSNSVRDFVLKASDQAGNTGSAHVVLGTTGNDTIASSGAPNEYLSGNGGNDTFVFSGNIGKDTVSDFNAANDVVQISHNIFADFASVLAHAAQVGSDVAVTIDPSNSITLHNTNLSQLTHNNIHIV